jgi:hypothetical protein
MRREIILEEQIEKHKFRKDLDINCEPKAKNDFDLCLLFD